MTATEWTPVRGERSSVTLVTSPYAHGVCRGDRITISGRRAVVTHADGYTLTVAYRDAWYWRVWWFVLDDWDKTKRHVRSLLGIA